MKGEKMINRAMFLYFTGLCLMLLLVFSCAPRLTTRASQVYMLSATQVNFIESKCKFIGNVAGASYFSYNAALNQLLDNAAEIGATHVFIHGGYDWYMRGDAYVCAYCRLKDGTEDTGCCVDQNGNMDTAYCLNESGEKIGEAECQGAAAATKQGCLDNCGKWVPAIDENQCKSKGYEWVPRAEDRKACEAKGGIWLPAAQDQYTCEEIKNGDWVIDNEVIKILKKKEEKVEER